MKKHILITGGAGFIGSNFIKMMIKKYPMYLIVNIDNLSYSGNLENLESIIKHKNFVFKKIDITNSRLVNEIFEKYNFDYVINFAAESHVDRSIESSKEFINSNIIGTHTLLEAARKNWKIKYNDKHSHEYKKDVKFLQVSTDEVYGSLGQNGYFLETSVIKPNSPYSASKASADLIVRSYNKTYGMPINITRCSNNYGPNQFPEKLIPLIIINCLENREIPVYGDGLQIRDWIHVNDHCNAIDKVLHHGKFGEVYNIGGNCEKSNIDIVKLILKKLGKPFSLIKFVKDRPGHDRRYAIDNSKIKKELGWNPKYSFDEGIKETLDWYLKNKSWIKNILNSEYRKYYEKMYK